MIIRAIVAAVAIGVAATSEIVSKSDSKSEEKVIPATPPADGITYYHVTTPENAALIMETGVMVGSDWEGGYVYAWRIMPNSYAVENSGAHLGTTISFKTNAVFWTIPDW